MRAKDDSEASLDGREESELQTEKDSTKASRRGILHGLYILPLIWINFKIIFMGKYVLYAYFSINSTKS